MHALGLAQFDDPFALQLFDGHADHPDSTFDDLATGGDDGLGLLAPKHGAGDFGGVGKVGNAGLDDFQSGQCNMFLNGIGQCLGDLVEVGSQRVLAMFVAIVPAGADDDPNRRFGLDQDVGSVVLDVNAARAVSATRQTTTAPTSMGLPARSLTLSVGVFRLWTRSDRRSRL